MVVREKWYQLFNAPNTIEGRHLLQLWTLLDDAEMNCREGKDRAEQERIFHCMRRHNILETATAIGEIVPRSKFLHIVAIELKYGWMSDSSLEIYSMFLVACKAGVTVENPYEGRWQCCSGLFRPGDNRRINRGRTFSSQEDIATISSVGSESNRISLACPSGAYAVSANGYSLVAFNHPKKQFSAIDCGIGEEMQLTFDLPGPAGSTA